MCQILFISRWKVTIQVSCYNICRPFKFMTIMSATNREGGGVGSRVTGRVRHCVGRVGRVRYLALGVGSGRVQTMVGRVGSGPKNWTREQLCDTVMD